MTAFSTLIAGLTPTDGRWTAEVADSWLQGRTTYGGLSGALCLEAARRAFPDLPALRSAQFAFIGPAAGQVALNPEILRAGKSSVYVGVDLVGDQGLATRAILTFGARRASAYSFNEAKAPAAVPVDEAEPFFPMGAGPGFIGHFEVRYAGGHRMGSGQAPDVLMWIRHRDENAGGGEAALIALGDVSPPAAMNLFTSFAPISSMTWGLDVVGEARPDERWFLMGSRGETVADGYSSQNMGLWGDDGRPLILSRQTVAIFG